MLLIVSLCDVRKDLLAKKASFQELIRVFFRQLLKSSDEKSSCIQFRVNFLAVNRALLQIMVQLLGVALLVFVPLTVLTSNIKSSKLKFLMEFHRTSMLTHIQSKVKIKGFY